MSHGAVADRVDIRYVRPYRLRSWPITERHFTGYIIQYVILRVLKFKNIYYINSVDEWYTV